MILPLLPYLSSPSVLSTFTLAKLSKLERASVTFIPHVHLHRLPYGATFLLHQPLCIANVSWSLGVRVRSYRHSFILGAGREIE